MQEILADLKAEQEYLDQFLCTLSAEQWDLPSPAEGWTLRDSVAHIVHIDEVATAILRGDHTPLEIAAKVLFKFTEIGVEKAAGPAAVLGSPDYTGGDGGGAAVRLRAAGAARQPDLGGDAGIAAQVHGISDRRARTGFRRARPLVARSDRLQQYVALASERKLDDAFRRQL